jgi:hypothetical protein
LFKWFPPHAITIIVKVLDKFEMNFVTTKGEKLYDCITTLPMASSNAIVSLLGMDG